MTTSTTAAPRPWRTLIAVGLVYAFDFGVMRGLPGHGLLSILVATAGALALLAGAVWAAVRGGPALARSRAMRAALHVALGAAAILTMRTRAQPLGDFHAGLKPGMSVADALRSLDAAYARDPRQWMFVAVWGTARSWKLGEAHEAARAADAGPVFNWHGPQGPAAAAAAANALGKARQVWFTFRTANGHLHFFVTLDEAGRVREVSPIEGHQT